LAKADSKAELSKEDLVIKSNNLTESVAKLAIEESFAKPTEVESVSKPTKAESDEKPTEVESGAKPTKAESDEKPTEVESGAKPTKAESESTITNPVAVEPTKPAELQESNPY